MLASPIDLCLTSYVIPVLQRYHALYETFVDFMQNLVQIAVANILIYPFARLMGIDGAALAMLGRVIIEDDVEIGSNTCIARENLSGNDS
ncbi:hypothetical protein ACFLXU_04980 [Chloroflexota bacterium]